MEAMAGTPNTRAKEPRAILVVALGLVLVFVSVACAAMAPTTLTPAHPCCPKTGQAGPDHCEKVACISNVPAIPPAPAGYSTDVPLVVQTDFIPAAEASIPELVPDPVLGSSKPKLFLKHRRFLI